jgi:hypothetical protein
MITASEAIISKATQYNIILGCYVNDFVSGKRWIDAGMKLIACGNEAFYLTLKFAEEAEKFREYIRR